MIYIIVPVHNRIELTKNFYKSLLIQNLDFKLLLIDDASEDGTFDYFSKVEHCVVLRGSGELFWGGAINLGLSWVRSRISLEDTVIFANNDVVLEPNTLYEMLIQQVKYSPCAYSPLSIDETTLRVTKTGTTYRSWFFALSKHPFQDQKLDEIVDKQLVVCDLMTARFLIMSPEVVFSVSEIDWRRFPHYGADDDFILSVKKLGFKVLLDPNNFVKLAREQKVMAPRKSLFATLFSMRSSSNIVNKYNLGRKHLPTIHFLGFVFFGACKSVLIWASRL